MIRGFKQEYCCKPTGLTDANKQVNSDLLAEIVKEMVNVTPNLRSKSALTNLIVDYRLHVCYYKAWIAIDKEKGINIGLVSDLYKQLDNYIDALKSTNPGSRDVLEIDELGSGNRKFEHEFFAFAGCIAGFRHILPLLFIGGTFLKGKFKGSYPLAFAVVDSENLVNWQWFLENLREVLDMDCRLTFFSDRNLGLIKGKWKGVLLNFYQKK